MGRPKLKPPQYEQRGKVRVERGLRTVIWGRDATAPKGGKRT